MDYRMLAGLFLLAVVPAVHGLYGFAEAVSSIGNPIDTIRVEDPSTLHRESVLGNPNGARFSIWLDQDCSFTAKRNGQVVYSRRGPATLARTLSFDYMELDCLGAEQLPEYKPEGEDVFGALALGGFIPFGSLDGLAKRGEEGTPPGCYNKRGSYEITCPPGIWSTKKDSPDEKCWLCSACTAPDAVTCTQAPPDCADITNVNGKIICNRPPSPSPSDCIAYQAGDCTVPNSHCCSGLICRKDGKCVGL